MRHRILKIVTFLAVFLIAAHTAGAQDEQDLRKLSMDDLLNVEVTTVSRVPATRAMVPASVDVITQEDIRRSGVTSIPEALRLAAGVQVSRIDTNKYAIGIRGFADRLSRSILVMIDGRAVYSPLFAGTYWEAQDVLLEDVDRIEVIRGPGGTLWGSNAVNGIINIITKSARDTQGGFVSAGGGSEEQGLTSFRYGGKSGPDFFYRAYGKFFNRAPEFHPTGPNFDRQRMGQGGFRTDWVSPQGRTLTIQSDIYGGFAGQLGVLTAYASPFTQSIPSHENLSGGNVLGRWEGSLGRASGFKLQLYYDRTNHQELTFNEKRNTFDTDFQNNLSLSENQELIWGLGYRLSSAATQSVPTVQLFPNNRTDSLYSAFVQDELKFSADRLRLTFGSKFERNVYTGFGVQPSARMVWSLSPQQTVVLSVARALTTPSRIEEDLELNTQLNAPQLPVAAFLRLMPNRQFVPEKLIAYEAGYRIRTANRLYTTVSAFFNQHDDLLSTVLGTAFVESTPAPVHAVVPYHFGNTLHGNSHGLELTSDFQAATWWKWKASYSLLRIQLTRDPGTTDSSQERAGEGNSPTHQFQVQSSMDLKANLQFDWMLRYVSQLPNQQVSGYATSNIRLGWRPKRSFELSLVGNDLHDAHHAEFGGGTLIRRSAYAQVTWRW